MFKVGFFYKKHTILDDWISETRANVNVPSSDSYVNLYFDPDNENSLMAVRFDNSEFAIIDNGTLV